MTELESATKSSGPTLREEPELRKLAERDSGAGVALPSLRHEHPILGLQRTFGNRAVGQMLGVNVLQTKLTIGAPDDVYEKEADEVAEKVASSEAAFRASASSGATEGDDPRGRLRADRSAAARMLLQRVPIRKLQQTLGNWAFERLFHEAFPTPAKPELQRKCACGGDSKEECPECRSKRLSLQRAPAAGDAGMEAPPIVDEVLGTPGQSLAESARRTLEPSFGHDFGQVRVHDDSKAAESASAVNAHAYTVGNHIVFGAGQYTPGTNQGNRLLAHELTHTIQQTGGTVLANSSDCEKQSAAPVAAQAPGAGAGGAAQRVSSDGDAGLRHVATGVHSAVVTRDDLAGRAADSEAPVAFPAPAPANREVSRQGGAQAGVVALQAAPTTVSFPPELILNLPPGTTPAEFIQNQVNLIKESLNLYWNNYSNGLLNFQNSMSFASEQEAESRYLMTTLKAVAKVDLDIFLEGLVDGCPELGIPIKFAKELVSAEMEEYERVEKAEGQVKIVEYLDKTRNAIGPAQQKSLDAFNRQVRPMQVEYDKLARQQTEEEKSDDGKAGDRPSSVSGPPARLLEHLESSQKRMHDIVALKKAPVFQEYFTEQFASIGASQVGPITAGAYKNATMYLSCRMYKDENGKYSVKDIDDYWNLKTNAPNPDRVASSLDRALKAQSKEPVDASFMKVVRATLEVESGHLFSSNSYDDTSYTFTDIEDVQYSGADAVLHGNNPKEFLEAWNAVLKEKVKGVKKLKGSGG